MGNITLSAGVRQNLLALQSTADMMGTVQNRLATGRKVSSALDNPSSFFTASNLNSRASDLSNLLDGMGQSVQTIQTANQGITTMSKLMDTAKSATSQALALGSTDSAGRTKLAQQVKDLFKQMQQAAKDSSYNGKNLLSGTNNNMKVQFNEDNTSSITVGGVDYSSLSAIKASDGTTIATADSFSSTQVGTAQTRTIAKATDKLGTNGASLAADVGAGVVKVAIVGGTSGGVDVGTGITKDMNISQAMAKMNANLAALTGADATTARVQMDESTGKLQLTGGDATATATFTVGAGAGALASITGKVANNSGTIDGTAVSGTFVKNSTEMLGTNSVALGANPAAGDLTIAVGNGTAVNLGDKLTKNSSIADVVKLVNDTIANSGGDATLSYDSTTGRFNAAGSTKFTLTGANGLSAFNAADNHSATNASATMTDVDFSSDDKIQAVLKNITALQNSMRSQASTLGMNLSTVQIRQDFTKNIINTLQVGADKLTLADTNEEGANMLALQTQQQLSSKSLSLASQADQAVLRLLG